MRTSRCINKTTALLACVLALGSYISAVDPPGKNNSGREASAVPVVHASDAEAMRVKGEQRFRANCGRCHAAPQKFPPRMMATVLRHMRVRATITDEDMRMVLFYMTQ